MLCTKSQMVRSFQLFLTDKITPSYSIFHFCSFLCFYPLSMQVPHPQCAIIISGESSHYYQYLCGRLAWALAYRRKQQSGRTPSSQFRKDSRAYPIALR